MAIQIVMPQVGESMVSGTITKWLKAVGDAVAEDEPLFDLSTDEFQVEIQSPVTGILREIRVPEGESVPINTVVAVFEDTSREPDVSKHSGLTRAVTGVAAGVLAGTLLVFSIHSGVLELIS